MSDEGRHLYMGLRDVALSLEPEDLGVTLDDNQHIYGCIVDLGHDGETITLAAFVNGTTSVYLSSGAAMLGLGEKYEAVKEGSEALFFNLENIVSKIPMEKKEEEYPLPEGRLHHAYLLTDDGIHGLTIDPDALTTYPEEVGVLHYLYSSLFETIKESTDEDREKEHADS